MCACCKRRLGSPPRFYGDDGQISTNTGDPIHKLWLQIYLQPSQVGCFWQGWYKTDWPKNKGILDLRGCFSECSSAMERLTEGDHTVWPCSGLNPSPASDKAILMTSFYDWPTTIGNTIGENDSEENKYKNKPYSPKQRQIGNILYLRLIQYSFWLFVYI